MAHNARPACMAGEDGDGGGGGGGMMGKARNAASKAKACLVSIPARSGAALVKCGEDLRRCCQVNPWQAWVRSDKRTRRLACCALCSVLLVAALIPTAIGFLPSTPSGAGAGAQPSTPAPAPAPARSWSTPSWVPWGASAPSSPSAASTSSSSWRSWAGSSRRPHTACPLGTHDCGAGCVRDMGEAECPTEYGVLQALPLCSETSTTGLCAADTLECGARSAAECCADSDARPDLGTCTRCWAVGEWRPREQLPAPPPPPPPPPPAPCDCPAGTIACAGCCLRELRNWDACPATVATLDALPTCFDATPPRFPGEPPPLCEGDNE